MKKFFTDNVKTIALVAMAAAVVFAYMYYKEKNTANAQLTEKASESK